MHEVGIIESALEIIRRSAAQHGAASVARVVVRVGALSGVEPEALRFAFAAVTPGSVAEGAELDLELVPACAHCRECDADFTVDTGFIFQCPRCSALSGDVRSGRELELARLEFHPFPAPRHVHES